jgi:hypothetical protein
MVLFSPCKGSPVNEKSKIKYVNPIVIGCKSSPSNFGVFFLQYFIPNAPGLHFTFLKLSAAKKK